METGHINRYLEEADDEGSWAISYADMITVLLGFFAIFFSFDYGGDKSAALDQSLLFSLTTEKIEGPSSALSGSNQELSEIDGFVIEKIDDFRHIVIFKDLSFFSSGKTEVLPNAEKSLKEFANRFIPFAGKYRLKIHSFTDPRPVSQRTTQSRGFRDNLELSTLRSVSVFRKLQEAGVLNSKIEIVGSGVISENILEKYFSLKNEKESYDYMRTVMIVIEREKE